MKHRKPLISLCVGLCMTVTTVSGKTLVREFHGTRSGHTAAFEVKAPWLLDWRLEAYRRWLDQPDAG